MSLKLFAVTVNVSYTFEPALMATALAEDLQEITVPGGRDKGGDRQAKTLADLKGIPVELFEPIRMGH